MFLKRSLLAFLTPMVMIALLVAACGNPGTTTTGSAPPAAVPTPTTAPSSSGAVVQTANATIDGKSETILTDAKGMALYYRTSDTATSVCSGGCAQAWPPLLFSGSGAPTSSTTLPGTLSVINNTNGAQVAYQGHPLYTFASDSAAGQATGQGKGGVWFVATTTLTAGNSSGGGTTPTPTTGNGYGGY